MNAHAQAIENAMVQGSNLAGFPAGSGPILTIESGGNLLYINSTNTQGLANASDTNFTNTSVIAGAITFRC
jgi:hypothetical protein